MRKKLFATHLLLCSCLVSFQTIQANGFSAMVSPPRFELQGKPGEVIRQVVDIENTGDLPAIFNIRTADWDLSENGAVTIHPPELQAGSCRPWARLERHSIRLQPLAGKRFRFELHIPEQASSGECRLAILVEPGDGKDVLARARNIRFPVQGRIAIIIYVAVGDARATLSVESLRLETIEGRLIPMVVITNSGNAHGRPDGFLEGRDGSGQRIDFTVARTPVLPGQTRPIKIWQAVPEGGAPVPVTTPLELKGVIEWDTGQERIDVTLQ
jgi:hypothetical protein